MSKANEMLEARARAIRLRAVIHAWEMRQRVNARGTSFEIERLFALTSRAWVLTETDVQRLIALGRRPHDAGLRLQPSRRYFVIEPADIALLADVREVEVRLGSEIFSARALGLFLFP